MSALFQMEYEMINAGFASLMPIAKSDTHVVPGVGPILNLTIKDGALHAIRSDGHRHVTYEAVRGKWIAVKSLPIPSPGFFISPDIRRRAP